MMGLVFYFSSLHFRTQTRPEHEILEFQADVDELLSKCADGYHLIGMDADARVPAGMSGTTGDVDTHDADEAGQTLVGLMARHKYWLPSTYSEIHSGQVETWRHPGGKQSRIDYFGLAGTWGPTQVRTHAWTELDLLCANDDHMATIMELSSRLQVSAAEDRPLQRHNSLDTSRLRDPDVASQLEARLMGGVT